LAQNNYNSFWKIISRSRTPGSAFTSKVGSAEGPTDVCSIWLDHYKHLFNSVPYDCTKMVKIVYNVTSTNSEAIERVSSRDISAALDAMMNNKAGDCYGLCTEHYKLAGNLYYRVLAMCINVMMTHGYIPVDATQTIIYPTVKDKKGDLSFVSNYHPIALATIFSKILEHIILDRIYEHLDTTDNQFGFKRKHSTLMPVLLLKEILRFYCDHRTNMYVFLDATKAFDRVDYTVLFQKLLSLNIPSSIVIFL